MKHFPVSTSAFGTVSVIGLEWSDDLRDESLQSLVAGRVQQIALQRLAIYVARDAEAVLAGVIRRCELFSGPAMTARDSGQPADADGVLTAKALTPGPDIALPATLLDIARLAVFCSISYDWFHGLRGAAAAVHEMYSTFVPTKLRHRDRLIVEVNRRLAADLVVAFLAGETRSFLILGSSPVLVDVVAARLLGLPPDASPLVNGLSLPDSVVRDLHRLELPDGLEPVPVARVKRVTSRICGQLLSALAHLDAGLTMVRASAGNLYRVPSFVRKRMFGES